MNLYSTVVTHNPFTINSCIHNIEMIPGSIPGCVTRDFFPWFLPTKPCALMSTQFLKMSTRDFSWGKGGRCLWLTNYNPCNAERRGDPWP